MLTRRSLLASAIVAPLCAKAPAALEIASMDGVLQQRSKPEALAVAKQFGVKSIQVTLGRPGDSDQMPLEDTTLQDRYLAESKKHGVRINATYIDALHVNCLKNDPRAPERVLRGIEITKNLKTNILMTVFFGKCMVENRQELDYVADAFKDLASEARKARVILGFENLLTAEQQAYAMDRVASDYFKVYYDVGNSTNRVGVDSPKEIRWLGKDRICQFHFKDEGYLGEGKVDFPEVLEAIGDIGFEGVANLETRAPSGEFAADLRRNLAYLRNLMV